MVQLLNCIASTAEGSERCLVLQLHTSSPANLICAYTPKLTASSGSKDKFYDDLAQTIRGLHKKEPLLILGDFNARVGVAHAPWPICLCQFGTGKRSLELCCQQDLCNSNEFFHANPQQ